MGPVLIRHSRSYRFGLYQSSELYLLEVLVSQQHEWKGWLVRDLDGTGGTVGESLALDSGSRSCRVPASPTSAATP